MTNRRTLRVDDLHLGNNGVYALGCPGDSCGCNKKIGLGSYGKVINYNTEPVINTYPFNRDGYWDCNDWITWHGKLIEAFKQGRFASGIKYSAAEALKKANEVFMIWWNKQGILAYGQDCYLLNRAFRDFWKAQNLPVEALAEYVTKPIDFVTGAGGKIIDTAGNLIDTASDVVDSAGDTLSSTSKVLKVLIPVTIVAVVGGVGYFMYKNYLKGNKKIRVGPAELGALPARRKRKSH